MKRFNYTYLIYCNDLTSGMYGCIYYGKHSTDDLNDGYIASGIKIRNYIKKYPNGYYRKILHFYDSLDELNKAEYDLIHPHLGQPYCLNLREGGDGGALIGDSLKRMSNKHKGKSLSEEHKQNISKSNKGRKKSVTHKAWNKGLATPIETRKKQSKAHIGKISCRKGKSLNEEQRKLISERTKLAMQRPEVIVKLKRPKK